MIIFLIWFFTTYPIVSEISVVAVMSDYEAVLFSDNVKAFIIY